MSTNCRTPAAERAGSDRPVHEWFRTARGSIHRSADVAQLVERNLAKVEVAGSNPVVRSKGGLDRLLLTEVSATWPCGEARVCKTLYPGSIPGVASAGYNAQTRALSSAAERCLDTAEVTGSIPVAPTNGTP